MNKRSKNRNKNNLESAIDFVTDNSNNKDANKPSAIDSITDKQDQQQQALQNQMENEPRSHRTRIPTRYVKDIQSSIGTTDGRTGNLPTRIQLPKTITEDEKKPEDANQIEHAMVVAVSETEAIDPLSLEEAMKQSDKPKWETAIREELNNLREAGTWTIIERPKERNIVKNKWVFRIKKNAAGKIERYKARLIAKGFTQVFGVDYYNTWAPVAKLGLIRLLLATAVQHGWPINMFNFHSAFLNGKLDSDEEVFMEQPQGFKELDKKQYVCKLLKSLYGLKQAGRKWYDALCQILKDIGFN